MALKLQYVSDYRAMPSAASAQRQGQVVAKQFKAFTKATSEYYKHPENFVANPSCPATSESIELSTLDATATKYKTIN